MRCARAIALLVVLLAWFGGAVVRADEPTAVAVDEAATPSWEHVRVVDVGGWEYRDVTIRWVEGGGQVAGNDHRPWASPFPVRGEG